MNSHSHTPGSISKRLYTEVLVSHPPWWDLGFVFPCALSLFSKFPIMYIVLLLQCEKLLFFKLYKCKELAILIVLIFLHPLGKNKL